MIEVTLCGQGGNRTQHPEVSMARTNTDRNATTAATRQIWQRARQTAQDAKPVVAQVKPLANDTKAAASRGLRNARSWAAPQVERSGQVLQETVAPKVAAALTSTARRLEPPRPPPSRCKPARTVRRPNRPAPPDAFPRPAPDHALRSAGPAVHHAR